MKNIYLTILIFAGIHTYAQQPVYLQVHHYLGNTEFAFNQSGTNDLGHDFHLTRLQYYMGEITLTYDGGQDTLLEDVWLLIDAGSTTNKLLGTFNITSLESISFGIGVDSSYNHLDPTSYAAGHPLAPQSPSMHWGWLAGYRFVALEGKAGTNSDNLELHALGDDNYYTQTISTAGVPSTSALTIKLAADYEQALKGIDISNGAVYHGESYQGAEMLLNFYTDVFSEAAIHAGIADKEEHGYKICPNPVASTGNIYLPASAQQRSLMIMDISGKVIAEYAVPADGIVALDMPATGCFFGMIYENGQMMRADKLIIIE